MMVAYLQVISIESNAADRCFRGVHLIIKILVHATYQFPNNPMKLETSWQVLIHFLMITPCIKGLLIVIIWASTRW